MEASVFVRRCALSSHVAAALTLALAGAAAPALAGVHRTANFTVEAPTPELAREIGETAEACRRDLAIEWLGQPLPDWTEPCPIRARVAPHLGAGGVTSFVFDGGEVFGWRMNIQGSRERILDSVVPHEVTHTIFASHFRRPLPRWADEGACTTVEHRSEIGKQEQLLIEFLKTRRGIPFSDMFAMKEYPSDVLPLYAQGHSLAHLLILERGKRAFMEFLADGMRDENWPRAIQQHYGFANLLELQNAWLDWVRAGRPRDGLGRGAAIELAGGATPTAPQASPNVMLASAVAASPNVQSAVAHAAAPVTPTPGSAVSSSPAMRSGEVGGSPYAAAIAVAREASSRGFRGAAAELPAATAADNASAQMAGEAPLRR